MNDEEKGRIARRIGAIDLELRRLWDEHARRHEEEQAVTELQTAIAKLASVGIGEVTPDTLARMKQHFQIVATEFLTRQEQCEQLATEAAELIARLEADQAERGG